MKKSKLNEKSERLEKDGLITRKIEGLPKIPSTAKVIILKNKDQIAIGVKKRVSIFQIEEKYNSLSATLIKKHELQSELIFLIKNEDENLFAFSSSKNYDKEDQTQITLVNQDSLKIVRQLPYRISAVAGTKNYLVVSTIGDEFDSSKIFFLRKNDGKIVFKEDVNSNIHNINSGLVDEVVLIEAGSRQLRWINIPNYVEKKCTPSYPPERGDTPKPKPVPPSTKETDNCECNSGREKPNNNEDVPPRNRPRRPVEECIPGDDGIPEDCVVTIVKDGKVFRKNICRPEVPPCYLRLNWKVKHLIKSGSTLLAISENNRRSAIINSENLQLLYENRSSLEKIQNAFSFKENAFFILNSLGTIQVWDTSPVLPNVPRVIVQNDNSVTYNGQSPILDWDNRDHQIGIRNVLIIPALEDGQNFNFYGDTESYFDHYEMRGILDDVVEYYKEVSYHNIPDSLGLGLRFWVFGKDTPELYTGKPIKLPQKFQYYWNDGWVPGGIEFRTQLPTSPITFSGDENMVLLAQPEIRSDLEFTVRFPAASFRIRIPASGPSVDYGPGISRAFTIGGRDRNDDPFTFTANTTSFPSIRTITFSQGNLENNSAIDDLTEVLFDMLQSVPSGQGAIFNRPTVNWHNDGDQLGFLHITFSFSGSSGGATPYVNIFDADSLFVPHASFEVGGNSSLPAYFSFPGNNRQFEIYIRRQLADATVTNGDFGPGNNIEASYFELDRSEWQPYIETENNLFKLRINLSIRDGKTRNSNNLSLISLVNQNGLGKIGGNQVIEVPGGKVKFSGGGGPTLNKYKELFSDAYTAMVTAVLENSSGLFSDTIDRINNILNPENPDSLDAFFFIHNFVLTQIDRRSIASGATIPPNLTPEIYSGLKDQDGNKIRRDGVTKLLRQFAPAGFEMKDNNSLSEEKAASIKSNRRKAVSWMRHSAFDSEGEEIIDFPTSDAETLAHELGHSLLGLSDQYRESGYRDDWRTIGSYDLMGSSRGFPHLCSFHKRVKGWLDDDAILVVDRPQDGNPIDINVVLIQLEGWNPGMTRSGRNTLASSLLTNVSPETPVVASVFLRLGGDGRFFNVIELRGRGRKFSQRFTTPRVVMYNAYDYRDDTRYATGEFSEEEITTAWNNMKKYRRQLHLIDDNLREGTIDTFDFATEPEVPELGLTVSSEEWTTFNYGGFDFSMVRLRIEWSRGPAIDLGFIDSLPGWQSPDIAVIHPDHPNYSIDGSIPFPANQPDAEPFLIPAENEGALRHRILVRVWNFGDAPASDVQIQMRVTKPAGAGDVNSDSPGGLERVIENIGPGASEVVAFNWDVNSETEKHVCFKVGIGDRNFPIDPVTGLPEASDDTNEVNNTAQQNAFEFIAVSESPPKPVNFSYQVYNDGPYEEEVVLVPKGLGKGAKVTVTPAKLRIQRKRKRIFRVKVELEESLLKTTCGKDINFLLEAWRVDSHSYERWGANKYIIKPRYATETVLDLFVYPGDNRLTLSGFVTPNLKQNKVTIHLQMPDEEIWESFILDNDSSFYYEFRFREGFVLEAGAEIKATARFNGNLEYASSVSNTESFIWIPVG
ncbi:MAG: hypothetical protein MI974_11200 [Chitinophagales bacterium]|nr:hypothetical protein [Chitinophagales bacterium]